MLALRRPDIWPAAGLALRRAVERVWRLDAPASLADIDAIGERFPALANARRPLSLIDPIAARRRAGHTAANHRGNDRVCWAQ